MNTGCNVASKKLYSSHPGYEGDAKYLQKSQINKMTCIDESQESCEGCTEDKNSSNALIRTAGVYNKQSALNPPEVPEVPKLKNRETENSEDCPPIPDKYKKKKKRKKKRVTICMTNCKYEVVRRVALKFGMREVAEDEFWDLYWTDLSVSVERAKVMKRFQKINHFPGMTEICRKDLLARNLNRMMKLFPKDYDFFPRTWCLPADLGEAQAYSRSKKNKTFICKPETGCQGRGIFLTKSLKDFTPNDRMICQVYLAKPFLIDGFKFDLRIYGLITSCDPLRIYIYNEGLARFATTRYREPTPTNISNVFMHLTNYAVNKHSRTFIKDVEAGSKRKISTLNEWLEKKEYDVGELWESIDDVIIKTVIAAHPILKHSYHACFPAHDVNFACFELLGFDVMLDYKLKPFVLEVNHSPSFHTDAPIDREVKESLLMDTFEILNLNHTDKRKMMEEDKKRVRERLLQGINGKESEQVNNVTLDVEDTYVSQIEWEQTHKGNFRLIYPAADQKKYQQFFHQNQGSLFQDTAASRAREECSRALREEIQQKAKAEAALRPVVNKKKDGDKQRPESPSIDTKNNSLKKKPSLPHLKKPVLDRKLQILNSFEPGTIDEIEERERVTAMAQRELLVKSFGILEHVYHILRKNNNLRPDDEKKYGLYGKLGCLQHLTSSYYMNSKLPAIFPQSVKAALPMRAGQNAINVHNHSLDDTNSAPTIERIADLGSDGIGDLGITCSHAPILMRPHLPRTLWMDESLGKESDIRFTKTHVARALSNTAKLQELEKREHRFCHNDNKA